MSSFVNTFENTFLDFIFGNSVYPKPVIYVGLADSPSESSSSGNCGELPDANGYERVGTNSAFWNVATIGTITNKLLIEFPLATADWGPVTHFLLLDSGVYGGGNLLLYGALFHEEEIEEGSVPYFGVEEFGEQIIGDLGITLS